MTMKNERTHSEYFEELCALSAGGQISETELVELRDHMQHCARCRTAHADFVDILHDKMPLVDPGLNSPSTPAGFFSETSSYRERFLTRARKQGLAVSQAAEPAGRKRKFGIWPFPGFGYPQVAALAIASLLAIAGILGYSLRESDSRIRKLTADMAAMSRQIQQQDKLAENNPQPLQTTPTVAAPVVAQPSTDRDLVKARQDYAAAEARATALLEQFQTVASELQASKEQNEQAIRSREQLEQKLKEAEQVATTVKQDLQEMRQARSKDGVMIAAQDLEMQKLSEKLSEQTEILERERALLTAGRDVHELMGARNLHIADVFDVDSKGKDQKAFGRIFYTEEKSLIFYAFDLGDRNTAKRNASYQVWGTRGPAQNPAQSLGIFYVDDQKQNRWILKFEVPRILAEIDSVFVTIEPPGGSARPTGRKFLYAYLNANPNHP
jgi:hypothetical protein